MSEQVAVTTKITFEHIFQLAQQLSPAEQVRLVAQLAPRIEQYLNDVERMISEPTESSPQLSRGQQMAATLQKIAETSGASGVKKLGLFGSFVRSEQNMESDIDLLVEFEKGRKTFDNFMNLSFLLEDLFDFPIELVTTESLSPHLGPNILQEVEYVPFSN